MQPHRGCTKEPAINGPGPLIAIRAPEGAARTGPLIAVACLRRRSTARTGPLIAFPIVAIRSIAKVFAILPIVAIRAPGGAARTGPLIAVACLRRRDGLPTLMLPRPRRFALALPMALVGCQFPDLPICFGCSGTSPAIIGWWSSCPPLLSGQKKNDSAKLPT